MEGFDEIIKMMVQSVIDYLPKLALALIVLIVGLWIIRKLKSIIRAALDRINITGDITPFLVSIIDIILKILLLFSVAEIIGIETASFIAVLAAGGFAIGLALQGNLGNFAAGVVVLVFKPYKLGDWVELGWKIWQGVGDTDFQHHHRNTRHENIDHAQQQGHRWSGNQL